MQRITADAEGLVGQAHITAEIYLNHALEWASARGFPASVGPAYVAIYVQACTQDFLTACLLEGFQEVAEALEAMRAGGETC